MSKAIPLLNFQQERFGFMLLANATKDYLTHPGCWQTDCVFTGTPDSIHLMEEDGYLLISELRTEGEHRVTICNNGTVVSFSLVSQRGIDVYLTIPLSGIGEWSVKTAALTKQLGTVMF